MSLGIVMMGAIVSARLPADLAGSPADPGGFAAGVGVGLSVNALLALAAAALAVVAIGNRRDPVGPPAVPATTAADAFEEPNLSSDGYVMRLSQVRMPSR